MFAPPPRCAPLLDQFQRTQYKQYTFMHNGGIPGFGRMKRQLLALLGDEAYQAIEGTTDSEARKTRANTQ